MPLGSGWHGGFEVARDGWPRREGKSSVSGYCSRRHSFEHLCHVDLVNEAATGAEEEDELKVGVGVEVGEGGVAADVKKAGVESPVVAAAGQREACRT